MRKIYICLLLILLLTNSYADTINKYVLELIAEINIAEINIGETSGLLGWNPDPDIIELWGTPPIPFLIDANHLFYVCDSLNSRINIYDIDFKYIKDIPVRYGISDAEKIIIDNKENIIALTLSVGLVKVNKTGDLIYKVKYTKLPSKMKGKKEFFVFNTDVLYFNIDESVTIIDGEGNMSIENDLQKIINKYNKQSFDFNDRFFSALKEGAQAKIEEFVKSKKLLKINGIIYTADYKKFKEYGEEIKKFKKNNTVDKYPDIFSKIKESSLYLIGYDNDGNGYWEAETKKEYKIKGPIQRAVIVCSKYGEILDCFYDLGNYYPMAVAPNGDVFFRESVPSDGKYHFYKVTRKWQE